MDPRMAVFVAFVRDLAVIVFVVVYVLDTL